MAALAQPARPGKVLRLSELIDPNVKQREFLEAVQRCRYVLYGGAAGGGKSFILRWWLLLFLLKAHAIYKLSGVRVGLFCEDYDSMRDRQISKMNREFPKEFGKVTQTKDEGLVFMLRKEYGEGFICLRNLDDSSKYQSVEFAAIGVDELTKNPQAVFEDLRMRLRWPGFPRGFNFPFAGATNPGSIGHGWVKRYWINRDIPEVLDASQFVYIKALARDNPKLPPDYEKTELDTIVDEQKRRAFKLGDWDQYKGQFFHEWRHRYHITGAVRIPAWWRRWRASDWGFAAPWSTHWMAMSPEGIVYVYRELYRTGLGVPEWAKLVLSMSEGEAIDFTVLDPACWGESQSGAGQQKSIANQCADAGVPVVKAANHRPSGWTQVRNYLAWREAPDGSLAQQPRLVVFDCCTELIRTLPDLPYEEGKEDLDTKAEDHAADSLRYGLMALPALTVQPLSTMSREDAEAVLRADHSEAPAAGEYWAEVVAN